MRTSILLFALVLLVCSAPASDSPHGFPLAGYWRVIEQMGADGHFHKYSHVLEYRFKPPGYWEIRMGDRDDLGSGDGGYTFHAPDKVVIVENYGDSEGPTLSVEFHFEGKYLIFKIQRSPDSRLTNDHSNGILKLRRIDSWD
jgi:hypothetical protein